MNAAARAAKEPPFGVVETGVVGVTPFVTSFLGVTGLLAGAFGVDTADFGDAAAVVLTQSGASPAGASWSRRGLNGVDAFFGEGVAFGVAATLAAALGDGDAACSDGKVRIGTSLGDAAADAIFGDGEAWWSVATGDFGETATATLDATFGEA